MKKNRKLIQGGGAGAKGEVKEMSFPTVFNKHVNKNLKLRPSFFEINRSTVGDIQYFPAWSKEWRNSVYHYNSNLMKNFPVYDINLAKVIKIYFSAFFNHEFLEYRYIQPKKRRLSYNKIFFARPEIKHTNSKAIITLYIYNREEIALEKKLEFYKLFVWAIWYSFNYYYTDNIAEYAYAINLERKKINPEWEEWAINRWVNDVLPYPKYFYVKADNSRNKKKSLKSKINKRKKLLTRKSFFAFRWRYFVPSPYVVGRTYGPWRTPSWYLHKWLRKKQKFERKIIEIKNRDHYLLARKRYKTFLAKLKTKYLKANRLRIIQKLPLDRKGYLYFNTRLFIQNSPYFVLKKIEKIFFRYNLVMLIINNKNLLQDFYAYLSALKTSRIKAKAQAYNWIKFLLYEEFQAFRNYKFKLLLNKYKLQDKLLVRLSGIISKIYNKQIEYNIVNLKNIVYNSDLFTQISTKKIQKRNANISKIIQFMFNKAKFPRENRIQERSRVIKSANLDLIRNKYGTLTVKDILSIENLSLSLLTTSCTRPKGSEEPEVMGNGGFFMGLDKLLNKFYTDIKEEEINVQPDMNKIVFNSIKYKNMAGIRMEVKGRLTPRYRADRSVYKVKWKGGLKNIDSSFKGLSVRKNRGHLNPNVGYSIFTSKRRVGAFAVKGWISAKS